MTPFSGNLPLMNPQAPFHGVEVFPYCSRAAEASICSTNQILGLKEDVREILPIIEQLDY